MVEEKRQKQASKAVAWAASIRILCCDAELPMLGA